MYCYVYYYKYWTMDFYASYEKFKRGMQVIRKTITNIRGTCYDLSRCYKSLGSGSATVFIKI